MIVITVLQIDNQPFLLIISQMYLETSIIEKPVRQLADSLAELSTL